MPKKKWLTLSLVGAALLLIPRRSSKQSFASSVTDRQTLSKEQPLDKNAQDDKDAIGNNKLY